MGVIIFGEEPPKLGFVQSPKGLSKIQSKNELRFEWEAN